MPVTRSEIGAKPPLTEIEGVPPSRDGPARRSDCYFGHKPLGCQSDAGVNQG
jgi:hypothetical protein